MQEKQKKQTICLLNDSFPPIIDGVSNTVLNYARNIKCLGGRPIVVTPSNPEAEDKKYPFPIARYPSINFSQMDAYRAGMPFSPKVARCVSRQNVDVIHSHCPIASTLMARELRSIVHAPLILTYHTKFDVDIDNVFDGKAMRSISKKFIASNIYACDEVWAVSKGAGENLRNVGYDGDYIVMPNGVDLPKGRVSDEIIEKVTASYDLPHDVPIYLFVGRIMWYKGLRIICDALAQLKAHGKDFRMVFIGEGDDRPAIMDHASKIGIDDKCFFTGAIHDREILRAWYCKADLFLFPSSYDTNGLVVREASACEIAPILIKDSCAAEGVTDQVNGLLIEENADSMARCLMQLDGNKEKMRELGKRACEDLYISWEDSVKTAMERYQVVIERYKSGFYPKRHKPVDCIADVNGFLMKQFAKLPCRKKKR